MLSTLLLRYPRFIHAELMTHRVLSRNAASSRAIPVKKIIDDILADTAMPLHWGANQKGMQADQECDAYVELFDLVHDVGHYWADREDAWREARDHAITIARAFDAAGYHKQVVNRLLEPFMHITVLCSATEWDNFLELRDHKDAEPHMQMLAREIRTCLEDESTVQTLRPGEWHLPFVTIYQSGEMIEQIIQHGLDGVALRKLSVARCASTSYKTVDGFDMTLEKAVEIYDRLLGKPFHASPFEHVAQADEVKPTNPVRARAWETPEEHGNFIGFRQLRRQMELR